VDLIALTRAVSPRIGDCELTHLRREPIDVATVQAQHAEYERALTRLGCEVKRVPAAPDMPDSMFIEDTTVVLDEVALIMRPGVESRRLEPAAVADALAPFRRTAQIAAPGTVDGGDVLVVGRTVFVGASSRSNDAGVDQIRQVVEPFGYSVRRVPVRGCLHLKSAVTALPGDALLVNGAWVSNDDFPGFSCFEIDPSEPGAANVVRIGSQVLCRVAFPRTRERLERWGFAVTSVNITEIAKAEGALTCCSVIFDRRAS
jgi:dimethylargininase